MRTTGFRMLVAGTVWLLLVGGCSSSTSGDPNARTGAPATLPSAPVTAGAATDRVVTRIVSMKTADGVRTAVVHHPATAGPGAALIVVLHPAATSSAQMESAFGWDGIADRDHVVVAYPDGLLDGFQDTWNGGTCCAPADELGTNDIGFLDALVAALKGTDRIGAKIYAVGFSNGAIMAYAWACSRPGALAAIGVVAGAVMIDCGAPAPLTVVAVHGTADQSIPIGGGPGPGSSIFPSLARSLAPFRASAGCPPEPGVSRDGAATVSTWLCGRGSRVITDVVDGVGHSWPGAGSTAGTSTGPEDATGFLWAHLRAAG